MSKEGTRKSAKDAALSRRRFLADTAKTVCGVGLVGLAIGMHAKSAKSLPAEAVRPPGALAEESFLAACVRCGLCVRACPYDILKLAELGDSVATGTPYFTARSGPCEMCEDIPCVPACPTGALDHALTDITKAKMGLAVLIDQESCIAFQGLRCEVCFNICPVRGKAIKLEFRPNVRSGKHAIFEPVVSSEHCTGCGLCERACILDEAAIKVLPTRLAKGEIGDHYRLGWKEKKAKGGSLVSPDPTHRYNLPEGVTYDHTGRGLIEAPTPTDKSTPKSALETLKRGIPEAK